MPLMTLNRCLNKALYFCRLAPGGDCMFTRSQLGTAQVGLRSSALRMPECLNDLRSNVDIDDELAVE